MAIILRKTTLYLFGILSILFLLAACAAPATPTPTPVPTQPPRANPTRTPRPTRTPAIPTPTATDIPASPSPVSTGTSTQSGSAVEPTAAGPTPTPVPTVTLPAGVSDNLLPNGMLQDANGDPSFAGWEQEPNFWCDWSINPASCGLHRPLPGSPSQTWSLQADRDYHRMELWPAGCCPEGKAWTEAVDVPAHSRLFFGWEELHHLREGVLEIRVFGISPDGELVEIFYQEGVSSPVIKSKQDPAGVFLVEIPIPEGGYPGYRVEVYVKLVDEDDGLLIGDFKLLTVP
jgi:hypothetical protein